MPPAPSGPSPERAPDGGSLAASERLARGVARVRSLAGETPGALAASLLALLSAVAYLLASESVALEFREIGYRRVLLENWTSSPRFGESLRPRGVDPGGAVRVVAFAASSVAAGYAARRVIGRGVVTGPDLLVWSLAAAIVPHLWIAALLWPDGRGWLSTPVLLAANLLLALLLLAGGRWTGRLGPLPAPPSRAGGPVGPWGWRLLAGAGPLTVVLFLNGQSTIRGFDSLSYHLPLAGSWLRHSRLVTGFEESVNLFYPGNFEILLRWSLALGTDRYVFLPALLATAASAYVLYRISRELRQPRSIAVVCALSALSLSIVPHLSTTAYSDTFMALCLLLAVLFLLRWRNAGYGAADAAGLGLSLGLALGTKYSAIPSALILGAFWGRRLWRGMSFESQGRRFIDARWGVEQFGALVLPLALSSAYWYVRNAVEHGNPLFPVATLGLPGWGMSELIHNPPEMRGLGARWLIYPWVENGHLYPFETGMGPTLVAVALVAVLFSPFARGGERASRSLVWRIVVASSVAWWLSGNFVPRYGIFPLLLSFVLVGELWLHVGSRLLRMVTVGCALLSWAVIAFACVSDIAYVAEVGPIRGGVPRRVDSLPPSRIFNAAGGQSTYHAMGRDYRHQVITLYREARPADVARYRPDFVLLRADQVAEFTRVLGLSRVATSEDRVGVRTSLWRLER